MLRNPVCRSLCPFLLAAAAAAQDALLTFRFPELTLSGSGGTVLQNLMPNEISLLDWSTTPCSAASTEKWSPRTCFHTMAGDENADAQYWRPSLFSEIDAVCAPLPTLPAVLGSNPRSVFWSPSAAMGTNISTLPLRPGDVGRISNVPTDGQVEYFMRQEQFNQALGLPLTTPIDVDAIAYQVGLGVFFSLDTDILATTFCGPTLIQDGALVAVPDWAITWAFTPYLHVQSVVPLSAAIVHTEAAMSAFVVAAQVADRNGVCVTTAVDLEAIEIDPLGSTTPSFPCPGTVIQAPDFVFATETMTGASLLTTVGLGQIYVGPCGGVGRACGGGPTFGPQLGIQPTSATQGAASYVNGLAFTSGCRHVLEPHLHQLNYFGAGGPGTTIDAYSPFAFNISWVEIVPATVPVSVTVQPFFSLFCFPDYYFPSFIAWLPYGPGFSSFPTMAIPNGFFGKLLFQGLGFGGSGLELSTPTVIDVN